MNNKGLCDKANSSEYRGSDKDANNPKDNLIDQKSKSGTYGSVGQEDQKPGTSGFHNYGYIAENTLSDSSVKMDDDSDQGSLSLMNHSNRSINDHHKKPKPISQCNEVSSGPRPTIMIQRDCMDLKDLHEACDYLKPRVPSVTQKVVRTVCQSCSCSFSCFLSWLVANFPIIQWMQEYRVKEYLANDAIAGFTIAILHIPQGMGYGILASAEAINGLYVSFFPVLIYVMMGTSRHISIGTFAVASLMVSSAADKLGSVTRRNFGNSTEFMVLNVTVSPNIPTVINSWPPTYLESLTTVCLVTGLYQAVMGKLHLGAVSVVLTDQLVSGFTTGVAFQVATSQLVPLLDLSIARYSGPLKLFYTYFDIFVKIKYANVATIIVSAIAIFVLAITKEQIQPRLKPYFSFPIPIDLIVVILATVLSYFMDLNGRYKVAIMGDIPTGVPEPVVPRLDIISPSLLIDSFVIAMVTFVVSLSMARIFAKKHKYKINPNQELVAIGSANVFSSFFSCYPCSASLSRSLVQEKTGGKTQMTGIISCVILLAVLLYLGPYLFSLPKCILSSIILVALKGMFMQVADLRSSWKVSRLEAMIWLVTFIAVIILDIDLGLIVGVLFSLVTVFYRTLNPYVTLLARVPSTEIYVDSSQYQTAKEVPGVKIFHFTAPLFFMNRDVLRRQLLNLVFENENEVYHRKGSKTLCPSDIHSIIIDCSAIPYMDSAGVDEIMQVIEEMKEMDIQVFLAACTVPSYCILEKSGFLKKMDHSTVFPTIHDAVVHCVPSSGRSEAIASL